MANVKISETGSAQTTPASTTWIEGETAAGVSEHIALSNIHLAMTAASTTVASVSELATAAETVTGTDTARTVTPSGLMAALGPAGRKRLSLVSATPVSVADQTAKTTIYWTDGSTNLSVAVPATTSTPFDVFYDLSDATLSTTNWTNDTTRATALTYNAGGYPVKTGDTDKFYLGTGRTTTVSGQTEDSTSKRYIWNYYNRVPMSLHCVDATNSWNYTTATWREVNGSTVDGVGRVSCVIGLAEVMVSAFVGAIATNSGAAANVGVGVGIDSTSSNSAQVFGSRISNAAYFPVVARYSGRFSAVGYHYIQQLEVSEAAGTTTWLGDNGQTLFQSGMVVEIEG